MLLSVFFLAHVPEESRNLDVDLVLQGCSSNEVHEALQVDELHLHDTMEDTMNSREKSR